MSSGKRRGALGGADGQTSSLSSLGFNSDDVDVDDGRDGLDATGHLR